MVRGTTISSSSVPLSRTRATLHSEGGVKLSGRGTRGGKAGDRVMALLPA